MKTSRTLLSGNLVNPGNRGKKVKPDHQLEVEEGSVEEIEVHDEAFGIGVLLEKNSENDLIHSVMDNQGRGIKPEINIRKTSSSSHLDGTRLSTLMMLLRYSTKALNKYSFVAWEMPYLRAYRLSKA